jgi:hypothetical protein
MQRFSSPVSLKSSKHKWENLLPPILSSGSFSDLIKAVLSTKSSNFFYKSGNIKALLDKKSGLQILKQDKTVTVKIVRGFTLQYST